MAPIDISKGFAKAILDNVQQGTYPECEEVILADVPVKALPNISKELERASSKLRNEVQAQSQAAAPDIDGWISAAKQLAVDIRSSHEEGQEIIRLGNQHREIKNDVDDRQNKIRLLEQELAFNKALEASLRRLQSIGQQLNRIQENLERQNLEDAVKDWSRANKDFRSDLRRSDSKVAGAFQDRIEELRSNAAGRLEDQWTQHIVIDESRSCIEIRSEQIGNDVMNLASIAEAMEILHTLDQVLYPFCRAIEQLVIMPRLRVQSNGTMQLINVQDRSMSSGERSSDLSAETLFHDLKSLIDFMRNKLPSRISESLLDRLLPPLSSLVVTVWLQSAVPDNVEAMESFTHTLSFVDDFCSYLKFHELAGQADFVRWRTQIPDLWLKKRQQAILLRMRKLMSSGIRATKVVEREETQMLSKDDEVFAKSATADEWNANWSDEDEAPQVPGPHTGPPEANGSAPDEETSAWGWDENDDDEKEAASGTENPNRSEDDAAEAWGWGEDDDGPSSPVAASKRNDNVSAKKPNGVQRNATPEDVQQVTLRETYSITSLPEEILGVLSQVHQDCELLEKDSFRGSIIAKCASSLKQLPALVVAFYRASSPNAYSRHDNGNMLLYNDSLWLAEHFAATANSSQAPSTSAASLKSHVSALQSHGRRAYSQEMDSQRTIITDLLDGAQGFINCTQHPFNQECDIAISSTIERIEVLYRGWKSVLSHSALLQAIGSLMTTTCSKMIVDIEDMSDISEPESSQLASYCSKIASLEGIFTPETPEDSSSDPLDVIPLTAAYVSSWLKFQYLANLLESSLADIKYMWVEGGLSLEFEQDEVIDLIVALFAEGPHRRNAIAEIRQARPAR